MYFCHTIVKRRFMSFSRCVPPPTPQNNKKFQDLMDRIRCLKIDFIFWMFIFLCIFQWKKIVLRFLFWLTNPMPLANPKGSIFFFCIRSDHVFNNLCLSLIQWLTARSFVKLLNFFKAAKSIGRKFRPKSNFLGLFQQRKKPN